MLLTGRWLPLWLLLACTTAAAAEPVRLGSTASAQQVLDQGQISFLRDPDGSLTLTDIRLADTQGRFQSLSGNLGAGYTPDVFWLRLALHRDAGGDPVTDRWWLEVLPPFLDDLQLYLVHADGTVEQFRDGDHSPHSRREFDHRSLLFRLDLPPGEHTGYLRISTSSSMVAVLRVWRDAELIDAAFSQYLLYGLYLGLLAAVLLLIAINWLLLRSDLYLLYLGYIGALLLHSVAYSGLAAQYLFPSLPAIPDLLVGLSMALATAFGLAFFDRMLDLDAVRHRHLRRLYMFTSGVAIFTAFAAVSGYYLHAAPWLQLSIIAVAAGTLPVAIVRVRHGSATQRLTGLAFIAYSLLLVGGALSYLGLFPTSVFSLSSAHIGNLAHLFLLHAAIMLRTRETERAHAVLARQAGSARSEMELERKRRDEHDQFLSMVAHEIRTPISIIDAATQSLQLLDEKPPAERTTRYERITRAVHRLNLLVELALHQVRPGPRGGAGRTRCDLVKLSCDVIDHFEPKNNQQINVQIGMEEAPVDGRAEMLGFVLINLLDNACKYSPPHSQVDINVAIANRDGMAGYTWTITDHGIGVPAADRERIFDKYFRGGEGSGTAGLGLGLFVAHHIAAQAGGTLRCIEAPAGCGARFECWLPRATDAHR